MLTIRMQRTGRKGYAAFRVVVQDSRFSPSSGRVVSKVGHYNPHTKVTVLDKEKIEQHLKNGAQPSPRVVRLLKQEKIKVPSWVADIDNSKKRTTKNPEKLRKNQPKEEKAEEKPAAEVEDSKNEEPKTEEPKAEVDVSTPVTKVEESVEEDVKPAASEIEEVKTSEEDVATKEPEAKIEAKSDKK